MIVRRWLVVLLMFMAPGQSSYVDSEVRSIAELLWASVRNTSSATTSSTPLLHEEQASRRRLWAQGAGGFGEQEAVADLLSAGPEAVGRGRRRGGGGGGRVGGGNKRAGVAGRASDAAAEPESQSGFMPRWKQDMLKNKTGTAWRKWLEGQGKEAATGLKDPAYGGRNTEGGHGSPGDYWKECGGMPKTSQVMKHSPNLGSLPNFYMYADKEFDYQELLVCYKAKFGVNAWEDERMWELAQNTGALWLHATLSRHRARVTRPEDAKVFIVPIDAYLSFKTGACSGVEHKERMENALKKLQRSHWWNKNQGRDHVFIAPWWGAKAAWGKALWAAGSINSVLVTFDEGFAHDWGKVVVAPYVPHALLTRAGKSGCETRKDVLRAKRGESLDRSISLYFRGSVMHGVNCKYGETWVRKAAYAAMHSMPTALFVATESSAIAENGAIKLAKAEQDEETRRIKTQENQGHFSALRYATELLKSEYCLHFRGDTTTSRRVYDAIAAGCVPVIVSDNTHVPFTSSINWNAFTVAIPERALLQATPDKISQLLQKLIDDRALLKAKQMALGLVRQDLLYGYGSPLDPDPSFHSRVADHVLAECAKVMKHAGKYRRFKDPKKSCVTKDSPAE